MLDPLSKRIAGFLGELEQDIQTTFFVSKTSKIYEVNVCDTCDCNAIACDNCGNSSCSGMYCGVCREDMNEYINREAKK